ncbi:hypothetical protein A33M_3340 [Rhodovulum sp. PH10]|uniref:hypothetical protein n=1 Tax=Rhodovulum sp. PH10 TaxID=1187851 RepID=UPI00027C2932|nr:hypothetical protein [Rhodovulum sp. PH10]EJW11262.1 hypothetical protein A33M_3340 [Rhodovulum sp. PH10]
MTWTAELVGHCLVEAFRRMPGFPIYAPGPNVLLPIGGEIGELDLIRLTALYLDRASVERVELLTWARAKAARRLREEARERGRDRGSQRRRVRATLERLATALNADGIAAPKVAATSMAEQR